MIQLMVLDDEADALRAALAPRLPADITARYYRHGADVDRDGLAAEVAFGQPDALAAVLPRMRYLRWLQSTWAGVTSLIEAGREDYCLTGVKGIFGALMSEYVLGWLLAQERGVLRHAQATHWQRPPERSLADLRLGIAGVGSIGAEVATRCAPFFREVRGMNRSGAPVAACDRCYAVSDRLAFAADLDALVLLLPDTPATRGIADAQLLAALRPGATLISAGRAAALDLDAALACLESGALAALVLDVLAREPLPDGDPLWHTPGVYITSHSAAPTESGAIVELFLDNLRRYRAGEPLRGRIDFARGY